MILKTSSLVKKIRGQGDDPSSFAELLGETIILGDAVSIFSCWGLSLMTPLVKIFSLGSIIDSFPYNLPPVILHESSPFWHADSI